MNNLFHALRNVLSRQTYATGSIIPFSVGRVYQTAYRNWHHDPRPLLFIIGSDAKYTIGINVHYLRSFQQSMISFIMLLRSSTTILNGLILYQLLKTRLPMIPKLAFRKYFTYMLRGKLVSEGVSMIPEPNIIQFIAESWVVRLNNLIHPKVFSFRKNSVKNVDAQSIVDQSVQTQYAASKGKPFADRTQKTVIQYRK